MPPGELRPSGLLARKLDALDRRILDVLKKTAPRYRAWDCPDCGLQVTSTAAMTAEDWATWCRKYGGCR